MNTITYEEAEEAITIALHGSGNDTDRFVLAMQQLGFDPIARNRTITITRDDLWEAVDSLTVQVSAEFTNQLWAALLEQGK